MTDMSNFNSYVYNDEIKKLLKEKVNNMSDIVNFDPNIYKDEIKKLLNRKSINPTNYYTDLSFDEKNRYLKDLTYFINSRTDHNFHINFDSKKINQKIKIKDLKSKYNKIDITRLIITALTIFIILVASEMVSITLPIFLLVFSKLTYDSYKLNKEINYEELKLNLYE